MYSCVVIDRRSLTKTINARDHDVPKKVVDVKVYLAERKLDVCDEQVEHGGMFWPQTMKVRIYPLRHRFSCSHITFVSSFLLWCTFLGARTHACALSSCRCAETRTSFKDPSVLCCRLTVSLSV